MLHFDQAFPEQLELYYLVRHDLGFPMFFNASDLVWTTDKTECHMSRAIAQEYQSIVKYRASIVPKLS